MKAFLKGLGIVFALNVAGIGTATTIPKIGFWIGVAFLVVPLVALFKPLPKLHLAHRGFSTSIAIFVGLLTTLSSLGMNADNQKMAELRATDPTAYLAALEIRDQRKWLAELEDLAPEQYAIVVAKAEAERKAEADAKEKAEADAREAAQIVEQAEADAREAAQIAKQAEAEAQRMANQASKVASYIGQLDREIKSLPGVDPSNYTNDVTNINLGLVLIAVWAQIYEEGEALPLNDEEATKRETFRRLLVKKQIQLLPALRDAYGPAMRKQLWEADGSARTIGAGYRTVEFVAGAFARNANIKQIHTEVRENLMMLRFTRAQYKWFKGATEFSYYTLDVPKDSDIVKWQAAGRFRLLN